MRSLLSRAALALVVAVAVLPAASARGRGLRLLTWNVGTLNGWAVRLPDGSIGRVCDTLARARADVVCLQEVRDRGQVDAIVAGLARRGAGLHTARTCVVDPSHPDGLAVVLVRGGPAPAAAWRTPVGFDALAVDVAGATVVAVHAPTGPPAARARYFDDLAARAARAGRPVVIAGDFNLGPHGGAGLAAVLPWLARTDKATWRRLEQAFPSRSVPTRSTAYFLSLDHAFALGARVASSQVLRGRRRVPMDHDPLVVELEVDGPANGLTGRLP